LAHFYVLFDMAKVKIMLATCISTRVFFKKTRFLFSKILTTNDFKN